MYCLVCERESASLLYCESCGFALVETQSTEPAYCLTCLKEAGATEVNFCSDCGSRLEREAPVVRVERASEWSYLEGAAGASYCVGCGREVDGARKFCRPCEAEVSFVTAPAAPVCSACGASWQGEWEACGACGTLRDEQVASALLAVEPESDSPVDAPGLWPEDGPAPGQTSSLDQPEAYPVLSSGPSVWSDDSPAAPADLPLTSARRVSHMCIGCGVNVDLEGADYCQACSLLTIAGDAFEGRHLGGDPDRPGNSPVDKQLP